MAFIRKYQKFWAIFCIVLWTHIDLCTAVYALNSAPTSAYDASSDVSSETSAPESEADALFDANIRTAYAPAQTVLIDVNLDSPQIISELRFYSSASYLLAAQEHHNGQWQPIESIKNLNMNPLENQWHRCQLTPVVETDILRLQLVPTAASVDDIQGIKEIEIWSLGKPIQPKEVTLTLTDGGTDAENGRLYRTEAQTGVIGPEEDAYVDDTNDNTFHFNLAYLPAQIKAAYLRYELSGLSHWISAVRSVNDQTTVGGYVIERGDGGQQAEAITPECLKQGQNRIRFVSISEDKAYEISNVEVLIELNTAANFRSARSSKIETKAVLSDVIAALKIMTAMEADPLSADIDQNETVGLEDAIMGLQIAAELRAADVAASETMSFVSADAAESNDMA